MLTLLVIEDGTEYAEFAELFLSDAFEVRAARSAEQALAATSEAPPDALLVDLRFDRADPEALIGDVQSTAERLFGGDRGRALEWVKDQQGTLILGELRRAGCDAPAVFVHDFPARRLANLRKLYGAVHAVPSFDAARIREAFGLAASCGSGEGTGAGEAGS